MIFHSTIAYWKWT